MDYYNLSKETLIHEIEQLNKTIESLRFNGGDEDSSREKYLNSLNMSAYLIDQDYMIHWANHYAINSYEALFGRKCYEAIYGYEDICEGCPHKAVNELKTSFSIKVNCKGQTWENHLYPIGEEHDISGVLELQQEVNIKSRMEEGYKENIAKLKQQVTALERKLKTRNDYIERFSKELTLPLRSLKGLHEVLSQNMPKGFLQEYLEIYQYNTDLLYEVFNRAVLMVNYDEGRYRLHKQEYETHLMFSNVIKNANINREKSSYHVILRMDSAIPAVLIGDEIKITLALSFILERILYYVKDRNIYVHVRSISSSQTKVTLKIYISDSSEETMNKPFKYSEKETEGEFFESSLEDYQIKLGVDLAKKLTASFEGILKLGNIRDEGIFATLYLSQEKLISKVAPTQHGGDSEKQKILIVDSEIVDVSMAIFESYDVYFAKTGLEAKKLFVRYMPELVIVDIMVEGFNGFELYDEIEKTRTKRQKIVAISNQLIDNEREFLIDYGFDDYFSKPLDKVTIKYIIDKYLK